MACLREENVFDAVAALHKFVYASGNTMGEEAVAPNHMTKFALSFTDIEDKIRPFDGTNIFPFPNR